MRSTPRRSSSTESFNRGERREERGLEKREGKKKREERETISGKEKEKRKNKERAGYNFLIE
jgi:hypothetical protein